MTNPTSVELTDTHAQELIDLLWQASTKHRLFNDEPARNLTHEAYCEYYKRQWNLIAGHADGNYVALQTAGDMCQLIQELQSDKSRQEIFEDLKRRGAPAGNGANISDEACDNSINLAARLLLMLKFGVVKGQAVPRGYLTWNSGSLGEFVKTYFTEAPILNCDHVRLPKAFNAWSIETIGGIEIAFTDNLADHLLLVEDDSKVLIFHHASFLECQQQGSLYPDGFIDETLRTLALLFPQSEFSRFSNRLGRSLLGISTTRSNKHIWLRARRTRHRQHQQSSVDARLALCGNLHAEDRQIERFVVWRDRLVILKQAYDDATPRTFAQWWHDRRNGVQWYTFWVAILVLAITTFLGVLQCVEGALQVYKAYVPDPSTSASA